MGRVIRREVIAVRCELRSCGVMALVTPMPVALAEQNREDQLRHLVTAGWAFVLNAQLRSYCPVHRQRVWSCTCRTNPDRRHLCTIHSAEAAALVWREGPALDSLAEAA
ncbi:MAG: hypothetical protein GX862_09490 [Leucobacter sp.]|nr:hypothetical protein [Leucobacter sp.]